PARILDAPTPSNVEREDGRNDSALATVKKRPSRVERSGHMGAETRSGSLGGPQVPTPDISRNLFQQKQRLAKAHMASSRKPRFAGLRSIRPPASCPTV